MMTFIETEARNVRPGALLMVDAGDARFVFAVREIEDGRKLARFKFADGNTDLFFAHATKVWVAQR